ncbi:MAG TPA: glycosyltransferase [Ktedonobacteraceae bacterium]
MTVSRPVILILATHTGGGHLNLAQSLKEVLEPDYEVVITDPQPGIVDDSYAFASRHFVKFLTWQYTWTDHEKVSLWQHRLLSLSNYRSIHKAIERTQPQLIIVTHAMLSYTAARVNERRPVRIPIVFQLTDLGQLHTTWFTEKHADAYLAPTREILAQALRHDIEKNHLYITGRPIRQQFLQAAEATSEKRQEILTALGLNPEVLTFFLQGGANGSTRVDGIIENWLSAEPSVQIILAAGNNKHMAARYANVKQVHVLPYTEMIAPYMAATDVIAGKAGASSISEAFILEKPFIATSFIPGQETANLQFLEQHNLGWVCLEKAAQQELLTSITHDPGIIAEKVESIRRYRAWNREANQSIGPIIHELIARS